MTPINIRPRGQIAILVVVFAVFGLIGASYFVNVDVADKRNWLGLAIGIVTVPGSVFGIWRALRLGVRIDDNGIRIRHQIDGRQRVVKWSQVKAVECEAVDSRAAMPIFAPVLLLHETGALPIEALGSYSYRDAQAEADRLRSHARAADSALGLRSPRDGVGGKVTHDHQP